VRHPKKISVQVGGVEEVGYPPCTPDVEPELKFGKVKTRTLANPAKSAAPAKIGVNGRGLEGLTTRPRNVKKPAGRRRYENRRVGWLARVAGEIKR